MEEKELLKIIERAAREGKTELDLSHRGVKSLPAELGQLKNLTRLDLWENQLTSVPSEIVDWGLEIRWEWEYGTDGIYLAGNPLESPPIEIVKQGTEAVRNYFESVEVEEETSRVFEAKLLGRIESPKETRENIERIIYTKEYYEKGGKMQTGDTHIHGGNVTFAYNQNLGISKEQFSELICAIKALPADRQSLIEKDFAEIAKAQTEEQKKSISDRIKVFLTDNGISVARSLTAAAMFELAKMFL